MESEGKIKYHHWLDVYFHKFQQEDIYFFSIIFSI